MTQNLPPATSATVKSWRRICIETPPVLTEIISSFLCSITGQGVEQTENSDGGETITAYLPESPDSESLQLQIERFLAQLQQNLPAGLQLSISYSSLPEEDWNRNWKKHFKPELGG